MKCMECLNEDAQKRKSYDTAFCTCMGRDDKIATSAKLLDVTYQSYGFSADLIEAIIIYSYVARNNTKYGEN